MSDLRRDVDVGDWNEDFSELGCKFVVTRKREQVDVGELVLVSAVQVEALRVPLTSVCQLSNARLVFLFWTMP